MTTSILALVPLVFLALVSSGCSLYQSPGRKYLEQSSYQFAGLSVAERVATCGDLEPGAENWGRVERSDDWRVWAPQSGDGRLRVEAEGGAGRGCEFKFASASEAHELTDAAIATTRSRF